MSSNCRHAPCVVEDESGRVALNLDGARIEGEQVVNRTEPVTAGALGVISNLVSGGHSEYLRTETILAHDIPVYVLGEVQPDHSVGKPSSGSKNSTFLASRHSEEERSQQLAGSMHWYYWLAIACGVAGVALLVWARAAASG